MTSWTSCCMMRPTHPLCLAPVLDLGVDLGPALVPGQAVPLVRGIVSTNTAVIRTSPCPTKLQHCVSLKLSTSHYLTLSLCLKAHAFKYSLSLGSNDTCKYFGRVDSLENDPKAKVKAKARERVEAESEAGAKSIAKARGGGWRTLNRVCPPGTPLAAHGQR